MTNEIFISVAEEDIGIAEALDISINSFFGDRIKVLYYASKKPGCGVPQGEQWFEWILKEAHICDLALVLLTPSSIQKPWIFFESGFIYGMARAKKKRNNVVRPIIYALNDKQIPEQLSPLQFRFGGERDDVRKVFREILEQYSTILNTHPSSEDIEKVITSYLELMDDSLLMAPLKKLKKEYLAANNIRILKDKQDKKNEFAIELGLCVLNEGIAKERLASETDEVILLALAEAISIRPEINDFDLLAKFMHRVGLLHVKYRVLATIWQLITIGYIKKENVSGIEEI